MLDFGQVAIRSAWVKSSCRVDFLICYKQDRKRRQWMYLELDGAQHHTETFQDAERAENLLVPELRYDNHKLRTLDWMTTFMSDVRKRAIEGAKAARKRARDASFPSLRIRARQERFVSDYEALYSPLICHIWESAPVTPMAP